MIVCIFFELENCEDLGGFSSLLLCTILFRWWRRNWTLEANCVLFYFISSSITGNGLLRLESESQRATSCSICWCNKSVDFWLETDTGGAADLWCTTYSCYWLFKFVGESEINLFVKAMDGFTGFFLTGWTAVVRFCYLACDGGLN